MIIVCATDDNFVQHCCIMLVSLLENNKDVTIYVLTEGLKPGNKKIIEEEVTAKNGSVHFCVVDTKLVEKFPMPDGEGLKHISRATYYRLLIANILPETVHKVIYLDCDIIINHSIQELWDFNLNGYALAAVKQIGYGFVAERLGYPIEYGYFNAGVNVINLDYFRENKVGEQLIHYIEANYDKIIFHDQDTLNAVLYDKTLHIMPQWNMTSIIFAHGLMKRGDRKDDKIICDYVQEKENALRHIKDPYVVHYVAKPKPWDTGCTHLHYGLYYEYAQKTINFKGLKKEPLYKRLFPILKLWLRGYISDVKQIVYRTDLTRL